MNRKPFYALQGWYPRDKHVLMQMFEMTLKTISPKPLAKGQWIHGIIAPHAGYVYSLKTAMYAYCQLTGPYSEIFVLGPSHRSACGGKAVLCDFSSFEIPLGTMPLQKKIITDILKDNPDLFILDNAIHEKEHSLEMQLPLAFERLGSLPIIPVVLPPENLDVLIRIGERLSHYLTPHSLVLMSSDLSHFPAESMAQEIDKEAMHSWETMDVRQIWETENRWERSGKTDCAMCGISAIISGITALKSAFPLLKLIPVHHSTSADAGAETDRVVGYGSAVIVKPMEKEPC